MLSSTEEIKAKLDIIDLVQEYFPLKQAGVNFKARCPFHEEKTPSFMVNRERQFYHCFGCHESGDIFSFIQKMENIEFPEALKILANKAGVKLPEFNPQQASLRTGILEMHEAAAEWFANNLLNSQKALGYLKEKRKLNDLTIKEWKLGYALDSWEGLSGYLRAKNFNQQDISQSGLVVPKENKYYDRFRDRVMFPIEDYHGNIVGFTGRTLKEDEQAKYINTPQTVIYNKSEVIFGLYKAKQVIKKEDKAVIVEGNMDVIASHQAGVKNVAAVSGTALTGDQIRILKRLTNNFVFAFDADEAGIRAAERSISLAWAAEANVRVIAIDRSLGKDPDELIKKDVDIWRNLIARAPAAMDYFFEIDFKKYAPDKIESKKSVAKDLLNLIIKLANPIEQDFYLKKLADKLEIGESALREEIEKAKGNNKFKKEIIKGDEKEAVKQVDRKAQIGERLLASLMLDKDYLAMSQDSLLIEYLPVGLQELYKLMVVYYTKQYRQGDGRDEIIDFIAKNSPELENLLNKLVIIIDELKELSYNEIISELKKSISALKKEYIKSQLRLIESRLRQAEQGGEPKEIIDNLLLEFTNLSSELK